MTFLSWQTIKTILAFLWRYKAILAALALAGLIFGLWQTASNRAARIDELKAHIGQLNTTINDYEKIQRELDRKVIYEKKNSKIAADSAAAVAAGRKDGDGPMSPVLRAEYERVQRLARDRATQNPR